jgi:hypothetical protein
METSSSLNSFITDYPDDPVCCLRDEGSLRNEAR